MVYNRQIKMKKILYIVIATSAAVLCSCSSVFIPRAVNTVNSVTLEELNLERKDYEILNTLTAESVVSISHPLFTKKWTIQEGNNEFKISAKWNKKKAQWKVKSVEGIARLGYLSNDYEGLLLSFEPEVIARNIAIYRLINMAKSMDADGVIEPVISTSAEQTKNTEITFKTTVQAKCIKLKTNN